MRTTINLPDDLHRIALSIARDRRETLSRVVAELVRRGLRETSAPVQHERRGGFPLLHTSRPVTGEDVRSLDDE